MKSSVSKLGVLIALAVTVAAASGCADEGDASDEAVDTTPYTGPQIARGVLGVERHETKGEEAYAADQVIGEIEKQFPGRLAQIEQELASGHADRVIAAKRLLDRTIDLAANSPAFGGSGEVAGGIAAQSLGAFGGGLTVLGGDLVSGSVQLVDGQGNLLCDAPVDANGSPFRLGRGPDGRFGDDRTGALGAARDAVDLPANPAAAPGRGLILRRVDDGSLAPDPESRLGAYAATRGYPAGTVGYAVHNAIGTIYAALDVFGEERIGRVFNSPEAMALYGQPVASCAGFQMASLEYQYWADVAAEDPTSPGGNLGAAFNPRSRDLLQRGVFGVSLTQ